MSNWSELYQMANQYKDMAMWKKLYDQDIFCVRTTKMKEPLYICIMGNAGEHFSLTAYIGIEGFASYINLLQSKNQFDREEAYIDQNYIQCSFEDRDMLTKKDLDRIKDLDLKYRGRNQWPLFRRNYPGTVPWYLSPKEMELMKLAFQGVFHLASIMGDDPVERYIQYPEKSILLERADNADPAAKPEFRHQTIDFTEPVGILYPSPRITDEQSLKKMRMEPVRKQLKFNAAVTYLHTPVADKEVPRFPLVLLVMERSSNLILDTELIADFDSEYPKFMNSFMDCITRTGKPEEIYTLNERTYILLKEVCGQIGIPLHLDRKMKHMKKAIEELRKYSGR